MLRHSCSLVMEMNGGHAFTVHLSLFLLHSFIHSFRQTWCVLSVPKAAGLWAKLVYLCAAFKHYTGWCLLFLVWLSSIHKKSMDLLPTLYISKCKTYFVLQSALNCVSCFILFCDHSIIFFRVTVSLSILSFCTVTFDETVENYLFGFWCSKVM